MAVNPAMNNLQRKLTELHNTVNQIDELSIKRNTLKQEIIELVKQRGLEDKRFSIGNRFIRYKTEVSRSMTNHYLHEALTTFFKENQAQAEQVYQYIIDNRPTRETEALEIVKKTDKKDVPVPGGDAE
jgi:DNA gyrase/topoisomerase IV subunit B